jgi:glycosyltransferase involved in cell wall biosynthesis
MTGVRVATGEFIAFLDDDDRWLPPKIETQLAAVPAEPPAAGIVVATRCRIDTGTTAYTLPRRLPSKGETFAEYLLARPAVLLPRSYVATPSLLVSRGLFDRFAFEPDLTQREDIAWLLQVTAAGASFVYVDAVLTVVDGRSDRGGQSVLPQQATDALAWGRAYVRPISPRLESGRRAALAVGRAALREGTASWSAIVSWAWVVLGPAAVPAPVRRVLHAVRGFVSDR